MKKSRGSSYTTFLALGIIIGVIIVIVSSFIIKMKVSADGKKQPSPTPRVASKNLSTPDIVRVDKVKDPVCDTLIDPSAGLTCTFQGKTYYFCSEQCLREFQHNPLPYVDFTMNIHIDIEPIPQDNPEETPAAAPDAAETLIPEPLTIETPSNNDTHIKDTPVDNPPGTPAVKPTPVTIPIPDDLPGDTSTNSGNSGGEELIIEEIPLE